MNNEKSNGKIKLFCIPYAGGNASIFFKFRDYLDRFIDLIPIELPGRGRRMKEELCNNFEQLSEDVFQSILHQINGTEYAILGHSLGGLLALDAAVRLERSRYNNIRYLFVSGVCPPQLKNMEESICDLSDQDFLNEIIKLGGMSLEFLENDDLVKTFLPILKSDYRIYESYKANIVEKISVNCDITAFIGKEDEKTDEIDVSKWNQYTERNFSLYVFVGNHFFINTNYKEVCRVINNLLV